MPSTSNSINFVLDYNVRDVFGVFDKTNDNFLVRNLLSSWSGTGNSITVNFSQNINTGNIVWLEYDGYPTIKISGSDYLFIEVKNPEILISMQNSSIEEIYTNYNDIYEGPSYLDLFRRVTAPTFIDTRVSVISVNNNELSSLQVADELFDILKFGDKIKSLSTGLFYLIKSSIPVIVERDLSKKIMMRARIFISWETLILI